MHVKVACARDRRLSSTHELWRHKACSGGRRGARAPAQRHVNQTGSASQTTTSDQWYVTLETIFIA